ncbi:MAG TPA: hypothetical protein VFH27_18060 [Longimicrobiaceae bacterium]|nr:hypothetical protein [Longimicrobiaceae bacterium]
MSKVYDRIYGASPISVQNFLVTLYGRKLIKQRFGRVYAAALRHYVTKDYSNAAAEAELQNAELRRLLRHAVDHSAFYRELYAGIDVDSIRTVADLARLPVVEKEELRKNIDSVYTIRPEDGILSFTGGTTGKSLMVVYTKDDFQTRMAYLDAFKTRCGVDPLNARKATFSGRSLATGIFQGGRRIFWRANRAFNQRLYSTFDLREENLPAYLADLNRFRPEILNGFVSAIHQLAAYVQSTGTKLAFRPKAIFTTSETLLPHHRELIERVFGAPIFDQYASAEGAPFITECPARNLHYNTDTGVIEAVDTPTGPEMLVTSFTSYGTPLIRYRIGDGVRFASGTCPCGSSHPLVESIEGRAVDYLYSPERGRVSLSHLADVIKGLPNCVREMQFVQSEPRVVEVRIVVDEAGYGREAEEKIRTSMRYRFGSAMTFHIRKVDEIARESSGKFRLIKNSLPPGTFREAEGDADRAPASSGAATA